MRIPQGFIRDCPWSLRGESGTHTFPCSLSHIKTYPVKFKAALCRDLSDPCLGFLRIMWDFLGAWMDPEVKPWVYIGR